MRAYTFLLLSAASLVSAASTGFAGDGDLPFLGKWDCEINVLTFTGDSYNDGTNTYPLDNVAEDGGSFVITLAPDYVIGLSEIEADKMAFAPMAGGDRFSCFRLE